jgi:O-antigen ligase
MARQFPEKENADSTLAFFFLMLYAASVFIRPHEMFLVSIEWITIRVFIIIAFVAAIAGQRPLKLSPQHWMLLALIPLIIISGFLNGSGMDGVEDAQNFFVGSIIPLFLFTICLTTIKRQHILMYICLVAALLMVHNGHFQQSSYMGFGWALDTHSVGYINIGERRITYLGFFNDPNDLGMFLVMNIPFTIYFYSKGTFLTKTLMLMVLSAIGYGIYLTESRGTMLGAGALLGIYYLVMSAGPKLFVTAAIFSPIAATVITSLQSNIDSSASGRLEAWYAGILMLMSNPVFGVGKGNFMEEHERVAHNSYIHIAGELGIPGYSLWGGALIFTVLSGYLFIKARKETGDEPLKEVSDECQNELTLNKTLFFSMIGFMITAFFLSRSYTLLLFIFLGMLLSSHIRLVKLMPELKEHFNTSIAIKSMGYCWVVIIAVYISLKMGL